MVQCTSARGDKTDRVRKFFAETVWSYAITELGKSESLVEMMKEELGREIAATLVPTTSARFTVTAYLMHNCLQSVCNSFQ